VHCSHRGQDESQFAHGNCTALDYALKGNHKHTVLALIEHEARVCDEFDHLSYLCIAAQNEGWLDVVDAMLAKRADPNISDNYGNLPLFYAADRECLQTCATLLDARAMLLMTTDEPYGRYRTAFHCAAERGDVALVRLLAQHLHDHDYVDIDVLDYSDSEGYPPLTRAAQRGFHQVCMALLDAKADVHGSDAYELKGNPQVGIDASYAPISLAAEQKHRDVCRLLLERRARVDGTNTSEQSALVCAAINGNAGVCAALVEHKAHLAREMEPALQYAMQHYTSTHTDTYMWRGRASRKLLTYANKAGAAFTVQARRARDQCVASHWTDSPLFDWHLVREITQYIEYPTQ
jgi:hypothetical protein